MVAFKDVHPDRAQQNRGPLAAVPFDVLLRALEAAPGRTADRLAALDQLRRWLDDQEQRIVAAARMDGLSWADIGAAAGGLSRRAAYHRWGPPITRLEREGLLRPTPPAQPPAEPADPAWAATPGVTWCRWCGQRLGMPGGATGWVHCRLVESGRARLTHDERLDHRCPGPEPWPAHEPWPDGPQLPARPP